MIFWFFLRMVVDSYFDGVYIARNNHLYVQLYTAINRMLCASCFMIQLKQLKQKEGKGKWKTCVFRILYLEWATWRYRHLCQQKNGMAVIFVKQGNEISFQRYRSYFTPQCFIWQIARDAYWVRLHFVMDDGLHITARHPRSKTE